MDEQEEALSRVEWKLAQEKLRLEHERLALERERLEVMRERMETETSGRTTVRLSSVALSSIICLLVGGILGAFSMTVRNDREKAEIERRALAQEEARAQRLQDLVQSLSGGAEMEEEPMTLAPLPQAEETNEVRVAASTSTPAPRPLQVKAIRPKGSGSGISVIVVQ